jgi:uncharacterized integral membrane protein
VSEGQQQPAQQPQYADESRRDRAMRYGHRGSLYASLVIGIIAAVLLILLIARNTKEVRFDYVLGHAHTALIWLVVISAITGWVLGIVTAYLVRRRTRRRRPA